MGFSFSFVYLKAARAFLSSRSKLLIVFQEGEGNEVFNGFVSRVVVGRLRDAK